MVVNSSALQADVIPAQVAMSKHSCSLSSLLRWAGLRCVCVCVCERERERERECVCVGEGCARACTYIF